MEAMHPSERDGAALALNTLESIIVDKKWWKKKTRMALSF
jgi:hypothetical protein